MEREKIHDKVCEIMMANGDGHTDGSEEIVYFIENLLFRAKLEMLVKILKDVKEEE